MPKKTPPTDDLGADAARSPDPDAPGYGAPGPSDGPDAPPDGRGLFDDAYYRLLAPFHTEEDARSETAALRELLGLAQSDRVLDLGCGWGRHLRLLAGSGHDVVGLDLSVALLRRARPGGAAGGVRTGPTPGPAVLAGDMMRIPLADRSFDVVINLASSLGILLDDAAAARALTEARRVLEPGGRFLVEAMHRADVEAHFAPRDAWTLADGTEVRARRRWDPDAGVSHEVLRWHGPGGSGEKRHSLRVRSAEELSALVDRAGFRVTARYGDWGGEPFDPTAPRVIVAARR